MDCIKVCLKWIGTNYELLIGIIGVVTLALWIIKKIWGKKKVDKVKQQFTQTTHGQNSPIINADKVIYNGPSWEDFMKQENRIKSELEEKHRGELETVIKEKEQSEEKVKELQKKLEESILEQPLEEKLKEKMTSLVENGKYEEAEPILYYLLVKDENNAAFNFQYASLKQLQVKYQDALKYYKIAAEIEPENSLYLSWLGDQYYILGDYEKAKDYFEKALKIELDSIGENNSNVIAMYTNIGMVWTALGENRKAIDINQKALNISLNMVGKNHPDLAVIYNNLSKALDKEGEDGKATSYLQKALEIWISQPEKNYQNIATGYNNLGAMYHKSGNYEKARDYYKIAIEIDNKILQKNHPNIGNDYCNLGVTLMYLGDYENAMGYFQKALAIFLEVFGENHQETIKTIEDIEALKKLM